MRREVTTMRYDDVVKAELLRTIDPEDGREIFWVDSRDAWGGLVEAESFATEAMARWRLGMVLAQLKRSA